MTVAESFENMISTFNSTAAGDMNKMFQWNITSDDAGKYALKIANGTCEFMKEGVDKADVTFTVSDTNWLALSEGKLTPMNAFMSGKLKLARDMMLSMKLQQLFSVKR